MSLDAFFKAKSVAIIGASHKPGKIGHEIVKNLVRNKYRGKIFPVNPNTEPILGLKVFSSLKDIKEKIDLAIIALPAKKVLTALKECVDKRVKGVIIVSSGFSETGKEGEEIEEGLKEMIKNTKTRILGVNCLGVYDPETKIDTIFNPVERLGRPKMGNISLITQSGAIGVTVLDRMADENLGISKFISYENATDINECDCLEYLGTDKKTKVIGLFLEGVKDGRRFMKVGKKVVKKKPVVVLKGGKSERGKRAVVSHTGSLAGSYKIYSSVFKQLGMIEAKDWDEFFDFLKVFSLQPLPKGDRIVIVTDGGGFGVLAVDEAERLGLKINEPSKKLKKKLEKIIPTFGSVQNPIDLTGNATSQMYDETIKECLKSGEYDGVIAITLFNVPSLNERIVEVIAKLMKYGKPIICCSESGKYAKKLSRKLEEKGIPVYFSPERAVRAMAALIRYALIKRN